MAPRKTTGSNTTGPATSAPSDTGSGGSNVLPATTNESIPSSEEHAASVAGAALALEQSPQPEKVMFTVNLSGSVQGAVQVAANTPFSEVLSRLKVIAPDTFNYRLQDGKAITLGSKILQDMTVEAGTKEVAVSATPKTSRG